MTITRTRLVVSLAIVITLAVVSAGSVGSPSMTTSLRAAAAATTISAPEHELPAALLSNPAPVEPAESIATQSVTTAPEATAAELAMPVPELELASDPVGDSVTVVVAGGCFWGVQGVFQHVRGVSRAESGYVGGSADTANYDEVGTGSTGHAESVAITFDPAQVTLGQILQVFFSVVHDPTQLDRQGPDTGSQYRSAVFVESVEQERIVASYIDQLTRDKVFLDPIVTTVEVNTDFFPAEEEHQDFLNSHPDSPYIAFNDLPKVVDLQYLFPQLYRPDPVLILTGS